jgi:hypothetical protein
VDRRERERIMREGGVRPPTPVEDARQLRLAEDLEESPLRGKPLRRRLRNFRPAVDSYIASLGGPLPYMHRLREIELRMEEHDRRLREVRDALRDATNGDGAAFGRRWRQIAESWRFDEVNDLIERHNRFFPVEARLAMDPRTGDYVLVGGRRYDRAPLDAAWILERFPADAEPAT